MGKVLSIVVAAYNVEAYLDHALNSCVLEDEGLQENYEVIVVNDGSTDGTLAVAKEYQRRYPEVFRIIDKANGGYGSVINEGINAASGKYFRLLDGDDWYDVQELALMIRKLLECDSDMVLTNYVKVYEGSTKKDVFDCGNVQPNEDFLLKEHKEWTDLVKRFAMHGVCYKTTVLKKAPVSISEHCFYTDTEYVIFGLAYVNSAVYFPLNLYQYRIGRKGQSVSVEGLMKHIGDVERVISDIESFYNQLEEEDNKEIIDYEISLVYRTYITYFLLFPKSRKQLQKIKDFDERIKSLYPQRYCQMSNRKIRILRSTKYKAYGLCRWYCKWERRREC